MKSEGYKGEVDDNKWEMAGGLVRVQWKMERN